MRIKFIINFPEFFFLKKMFRLGKEKLGNGAILKKKASEQADALKLIASLVLFFAVSLSTQASFFESATLAYLFFVIIRKTDYRLTAALALGCLAATPVFLYLVDEEIAETLAVYAFYFLSITVIQQIEELLAKSWEDRTKTFSNRIKKINPRPFLEKLNLFRLVLRREFIELPAILGYYWMFFLGLAVIIIFMRYIFAYDVDLRALLLLVFLFVISVAFRLCIVIKNKTVN